MQESIPPSLAAWESYYIIVGSSAAALTGLMFVVIALVAESRRRTSPGQIDAFGTPTVVHFCAVLLVSAVLSAPWPTLSSAAVALDASGVAGVGYVVLVARRTRRQTGYKVVLEDWLWHVALPLVAYAVLLGASLTLDRHPTTALFLIAATALLLLFVGIHNAWDTVTFVAAGSLEAGDEPDHVDGVPQLRELDQA